MQGTDVLLSLAGIAGVFVGFGALISIRSDIPREAYEVSYVRAVVSFGLIVVVGTLVPVTLSHYDITDHQVRLLSSLLILALFWGIVAVDRRAPEARATEAASPRARRAVTIVLIIAVNTTLVLVVLGLIPDLEPALYLTAVVLVLLGAASFLLSLVYSQGRPQTVSDAASPTATGGLHV